MFILSTLLLVARFSTTVTALPVPAPRDVSNSDVRTNILTGVVGAIDQSAKSVISRGTLKARDDAEIDVSAQFDTPYSIIGGEVLYDTNMVYPAGPAGHLELDLEILNNHTMSFTVSQNNATSGLAPDGFIFVDPTTYIITLDTTNSTLSRDDHVQMEYKFTDAVVSALVANEMGHGVLAKLDPATNAFMVKTVGTDREDQEWELDIISTEIAGEWAVLVPAAFAQT